MERFTGEQLKEVRRTVINSLRPPVSFLSGRSILQPLIEWIRLHESFNGVLIVLGLIRTGNLIRLLLKFIVVHRMPELGLKLFEEFRL
ncbi:hypothetical protein HanIR_Chr06g0263071 [Helianthus annuus]|nr:hypothetical protein HanIR_Chr06g0263071 [Helianthus annuus]